MCKSAILFALLHFYTFHLYHLLVKIYFIYIFYKILLEIYMFGVYIKIKEVNGTTQLTQCISIFFCNTDID